MTPQSSRVATHQVCLGARTLLLPSAYDYEMRARKAVEQNVDRESMLMCSTGKPLVSIVIVTWNRRDLTREVLRRIQSQTYLPYEVVVVDNGSADGTPEMIQREFPDVRLICLATNIGIGAFNLGVAQSRGDFLVGLDDDSFPAPDAIQKAVVALQSDAGLGIVAGTIASPEGGDQPSAWWLSDNRPLAEGGAPEIAFTGGGFVARTRVWRETGGYPESLFIYHNEFPVAIAFRLAGYRIKRFSDVVFYHYAASRADKATRAVRHFYYPFRNLLILYDWYYPFPTRIVLKLQAMLFYAIVSARSGAIREYARFMGGVGNLPSEQGKAAASSVHPRIRSLSGISLLH